MQTPRFISNSQVIKIHERQIEIFGGTTGIKDEGLLDSALAQPQATFGGELLHATIPEQAVRTSSSLPLPSSDESSFYRW